MTNKKIKITSADDENTTVKGGNGDSADSAKGISPEDVISAYKTYSTKDKSTELEEEIEAEENAGEQSDEEQTDNPPEPPLDEKADLTNRMLRIAAEFENYKKKNAREFSRGHDLGMTSAIERLVPVLDSFDSAVASGKDAKGSSIYEGLVKIQNLMTETLIGAGMGILDPEKGEIFDPNFHEVLLTHETEELPDQSIWACLQKGYTFKGRLVRAAKVQVAVAPE